MKRELVLAAILALACVSSVHAGNKGEKTFANSIGMKLLRIEPGTFMMGMESTSLPDKLATRPRFKNGDYDETPRHKVTISQPFCISETEVTIEQFKKFRPDYPGFKARLDHHPYVSGISWFDAVAFCKWLSNKEGKPYRLPTEAEWEYACRAGTQTPFSSGNTQPEHETANSWGLKNMHTGVLEWCLDWHGLYPETPQTDPVGPQHGWMKVVRSGGLDFLDKQTMSFYFGRDVEPWALGASPFYARSANRAAVPPSFAPPPREYQAKQMEGINPPLPPGPQSPSPYRAKGMIGGWHYIGFRVVQAPMPNTKPDKFEPPFFQRCVKQSTIAVAKGPNMTKPYYRTRRILPALTTEQIVNVGWKIGLPPGLGTNHHNGAVVALPNGDLLAVYYNGFVESDPDLSILVVRLRYGSNHWDVPSVWPDFLDGNDASPFIFVDNGATWGPIQFPVFDSRPGGYGRRQPINSSFRGADNTLYVAFDGWGSTSGLWATANNGQTWFDTGGRTLGLHATFVLLDDNSILAYGTRNRTIDGFCPKNISTDWGKTWQVSRSPMPGQGGGRNPIMIKLASGRLLYVTNMGKNRDPNVKGFTGGGAYAGLSSDNGQTWRIRKLLGGQTRNENGKPVEVRTVGYVGATQSQNGIIHLVTSRNNPDLHIELNESWILADDGAAKAATLRDDVKIIPGTVKVHQEYYPNDKLRVSWRAGTGEDGRYLLHGSEIWRYQNGQRQWEVSYHAGRKVGAETYWNSDGTKKWQRTHREDGTSVWTVYSPDGKLKAESHWRNKKRLSHSVPKGAKLDIKVDFGLPIWSGPDNERGSDEPVHGMAEERS
jgi:formylglycine-generating enzyme required for sulfatase activity